MSSSWPVAFYLLCSVPAVAADFPRFQAQVIDPHAGEVCYAITAADVNGDGKPDVVVVTEDAVIWYENPTWQKHDIIRGATARDNVCIQPHDIDGDGHIDFALGAGWRATDTKRPSTLQWLGRDAQGRWQLHPIAFEEPTLHRLRWGDVKGTGSKQLVVAPLQGRETKGPNWGQGQGVRILVHDIPKEPADRAWPVEIADSVAAHDPQPSARRHRPAMGATRSSWRRGKACSHSTAIRRANWTKTKIGTGNQQTSPFKGASEVKVGHLRDNAPFIATIEPWHGFQVVVYSPGESTTADQITDGQPALWTRQVIAEPVQWGHAVWCADLDADGDDELIIGQRDPNKPGATGPKGPGLFVFDAKPGTISARLRPPHARRWRHGLRRCPRSRPRRRRPHGHHRRRPGDS